MDHGYLSTSEIERTEHTDNINSFTGCGTSAGNVRIEKRIMTFEMQKHDGVKMKTQNYQRVCDFLYSMRLQSASERSTLEETSVVWLCN